ncbi:MAG: hypothetical protein NC187_01035 [Candidatus Amulumruptor caecigallinarius]|nr:hypothetical protein [Candidatus Amulumruptor caecigallinarius]MCM1396060.1 hypothetical protein [Candidatus Amulumruptor caecigallinarius]MCM1453059.1 hypothetical protein [bacterium]
MVKLKNITICALTLLCLAGGVPCYAQTLDEAREALARYDADSATDILDALMEASQARGKKKKPLPEGYDSVKEQLQRLSAALERVEIIEVIDSVELDKADFYLHIPLSASAGRFMAPSALPAGSNAADSSAVYVTEDGSSTIYAAKDASGRLRLMETYPLSDGTFAPSQPLEGELGDGDLNWAWLSPDGITLYYSARGGDDNLGGYDIYMTRREDGRFLLPQSLGMPYNSAANDYLYIIDEVQGLGWWATDRHSTPGKVTLYTFIPTELRRNYPPDTPTLGSLALMSNYKATLAPGKDYSQPLTTLAQARAAMDTGARVHGSGRWALEVPGVGIITSLSSFRSPQARELMAELLDSEADFETRDAHLARLRRAYGRGKHDVADEILQAEQEREEDRQALLRLRNDVIRAEASAH